MKRFLLCCFALATLTACHVENDYYNDTPTYDSYYNHRHHGFGHRHGRNYIVPENRHGHGDVIVIPDSRNRSNYHGHDERRAPSNYHGHDERRAPSNYHGHDDKQIIIGNRPANFAPNVHGHG